MNRNTIRQETYKANQRKLGLSAITIWVPEKYVNSFLRAADRVRLDAFEEVLQHGAATDALEALANRNSPQVENVGSFETFVSEHPDLIEGGPRHKQAVSLYNRYRKLVQQVHQQRGKVASLMAVNAADILVEKAALAVMGQRVRDMLNELDFLRDCAPTLTVTEAAAPEEATSEIVAVAPRRKPKL